MDAGQLGAFIRAHFTDHPEPAGRTAFRLETLDAYEVASDGTDYGRYLAGADAPTAARKKPWEDRLEAERQRGLRRSRVHVVETRPGELLPPYLEYEAAWSYTRNVRWEDIRILDLGEVHLTAGERDLFVEVGDFCLLGRPGDRQTIRMDYDPAGAFLGADVVDADGFYARTAAQAAAVAWGYAAPFGEWWARHQQHRRRAA